MENPLIAPKFVPISPTIPDEAVFATAPALEKRAKLETVPKTSTSELGLQSLKHFIGIVIGPLGALASVPAPKVIAPSEVSNLPSISQPAASVIAPGCANKVPTIEQPVPALIAPSDK